MFTDSSDPQTRDAIIARALRLPRAVGMELMPQMVAWDGEFAEHALTSAKMPVTVLQSTRLDASRHRASLKAGETSPWLALVEKLVPHGEIVIVPGVGHFTMIEAADVVNRHMEAILEKIAGS
jgi:pimeloyl-ACP methyl ester carboxylesterase